ncbi:MAG: flagellar motor switch protein FliM [Clostridia bacterium]|jgi:flagellar motor switch protein FliM|nr:flagellar motor switch protein FliM [Clostridia bacterium]
MGDILSQNEIDDLLKALNEGELDVDDMSDDLSGKKVKDYDFARPSKFAKDQLKTLENIFENYSRVITTYLSGNLRTNVTVNVLNSEAITYYEFSNSLSNPVILGIVDFRPLKGSIILELSPNIGYAIVERVLGGPGTDNPTIREFTEVEKSLISRVIHQFLRMLKEPFETVTEIDPKLEKIETNSQFAQVISPSEMVALVTLNIKVGDTEGMMNICIPYSTIEPALDKLSTKYWFIMNEQSKDDRNESFQVSLGKQLETADVAMKAILGRTSITVSEFTELQVGDVIKLKSKVEDNLEVMVEDEVKFYAKPGKHKKLSAVKITSIVEGDE